MFCEVRLNGVLGVCRAKRFEQAVSPQESSPVHRHFVILRACMLRWLPAHRRLLRRKASPEGLGGSTQPTFLHNLAAVLVDDSEVGVFVGEVHSGRYLGLLFATIHGGPILLFGP